METMEIDGKQYEVIGHADDGLPIIRGIATSKQDGVDKDGNLIISTNISVPTAELVGTPGEVK
jgi:hypothetical protein